MNRFKITESENELRELEKWLADDGELVRCSYDPVWSHKYQSEKRKSDFIINFERYNNEEDYKDPYAGGYDGEVHECFYLLDNDGNIVVTEIS